MRVLLLNPPGKDLYIRDYFCSKTTKSNYLFHPIDLLALSGVLAERHEVVVLDAIAERLSPSATRNRVVVARPDAIISLVGAVSWEEDRSFLRDLAKIGAPIFAIGDVLHDGGEAVMREEPWMAGCFQNFANGDALALVEDRFDDLDDATVRRHGAIERVARRGTFQTYHIPTPRHDLFPTSGYSFPFARRTPFATVLTDYGCPYPCTFCVIGTLGFAQRPILDVIEEFRFLRDRSVRELFVMDQTFGVVRERGLELCERMTNERFGFTWTAFARPDLADETMMRAMRRAGCHTIIMGVETPDDDTLDRYRKGYRSDAVRAAFARAHRVGLRTVGTFIIGLPEETAASIRRTVEYAIALRMDFASFNLAVPRVGTQFRDDAITRGFADPAMRVMDQAGSFANMSTTALTPAAMLALKKQAVRAFFLRPAYLLNRVMRIRTTHELRSQLAEGLALLRRNVG